MLKNIWKFIRTLSGDDAYEVYLNNFIVCKNHSNKKPLSRKDFFCQQLQKKWNKINRCC
ncbi:CstA-like transporter-associated (seleno)protein [Methylophilaceae bacterium]|nr:CstA-like transporter-associated (seleno)protein [Methylophilaceae bacterium]